MQAQEKWILKKSEDGIEVYSRKLNNEKYREIKVVCAFKTTEKKLVEVLKNVDDHKTWVYNTRLSYLLKRKATDTLIYYTEISVPWPANNRDVVIQLTFHKDSMNNILNIEARNIQGMVPIKKDIVRIPYSLSNWSIKEVNINKIQIEYILKIDPGGALPVWLVNYTAAIGPLKTFKKLKMLTENL